MAAKSHVEDVSFPPYDFFDATAAAAGLEDSMRSEVERVLGRTRKLERLYHSTLSQGWDPRAVLGALIEKHGAIEIPLEKRAPLSRVMSVLLWGELAAWNVAAELAGALPSLEAKMAATGQVFDEARHFGVLRDYLRAAGLEPAPLPVFSRRLMVNVLRTKNLVHKVYGMQLTIELVALAIFKRLAAAKVEPVLTELLEYIQRDEARHVGLGVIHLPRMMQELPLVAHAGLAKFSFGAMLSTFAGGRRLADDFTALGISNRELALTSGSIFNQLLGEMRTTLGLDSSHRIRGLNMIPPESHEAFVNYLFPEEGDVTTPFQHVLIRSIDTCIAGVERLLS